MNDISAYNTKNVLAPDGTQATYLNPKSLLTLRYTTTLMKDLILNYVFTQIRKMKVCISNTRFVHGGT